MKNAVMLLEVFIVSVVIAASSAISDIEQGQGLRFKEERVLDDGNSTAVRGKLCSPTPSCESAGGHCIKNAAHCYGAIDSHTCRGRKCKCCIPGDCFPHISCTMAGGRCVKKSEECYTGVLDPWGCTGPSCKCCLPDYSSYINVTYSLKVFGNETNTLELLVPPHISFFEVMKNAQDENYDFRFNYTWYDTESVTGAFITSIGGLAPVTHGDQSGDYWMFYNCNKTANPSQYPDGCEHSDKGVSITFPNDDDIWLFAYERVQWS